ncbi:amino acid adenylation domain-containing protein, partial [Maribacter sp. 2307UL18-2]|uniref:amino acid adenylation domain-containing protein n=1 Tax=Maribacter sp. 2307UL18-2 TaxID=3386274 RepID=UPI0039BD0F5F
MEDISRFLYNLRRNKNISIAVDNTELIVSGEKELLDVKLTEEIKRRKHQIIKYLESQQRNPDIQIPESKIKEYYELSSAQSRVYFEKALNQESVAYNIPTILKLDGMLNFEKFENTFKKIIERHEILRTSFKLIRGEVFQKIHPTVEFKIKLKKTKKSINSLVSSFIKPFELSQAPLFRIGLFQLAPNDYLLIFDIHHIITDGVTNTLLIKEFTQLYNNEELPKPKLQYRDYSEWQQSTEYKNIVANQKKFWQNTFKEKATTLKLPVDRARYFAKKPTADHVNIIIDRKKTAALKRVIKDLSTTQFTTLLSIFYIVLSKYSNQYDIIIGTASTGRANEELEKSFGMFVNTIPLRNFPKVEYSFKGFLENVKISVAQCFDNEMYQFENLINDLKIEREPNRNPLFDVFFTHSNYDQNELKIPEMTFKPYGEGLTKTKFDLELASFESDGQIFLTFIFNSNLFNKDTIERYSNSFLKIVSQVILDYEIKLSDFDLLAKDEKNQILFNFNNTQFSYPKNKTIIDLFEEQVEKTPTNVAIVNGNNKTTYEELNKKSDQLAIYLQHTVGVKPGDFVGLLLDREEELIPCIYGILKSGAVYVPLSTTNPSARLNSIISDAGLKWLITRTDYIDDLGIKMESGLLDLNLILEKIQVQTFEKNLRGPKGNDLAYVIYTSGSTGHPKGVMIEHHSVVNRLLWMQHEYPLSERDVLLQKTPLAFDVSIWELFWWSFTGASLYILPPKQETNPKKIIQAIEKHKITTIHFVPSMLSVFLDYVGDDYHQVKTLNKIFASGEALQVKHVNSHKKILYAQNNTRLINLYGPTEATVDVSYYECDFSKIYESIPIGRPIHNTQLYVLDENGYPLPIGAIGELYITGVGLSRGYLNKPNLTNNSFVSNLVDEQSLFYKTGDLACWLPDGNLKYHGRVDTQVKINGNRIELGEIEYELRQINSIKEAAVTVHQGKTLVAHYVSENKIEREEFSNCLSLNLPSYMLPAYYLHKEKMPLTSNGKLDRKLLSESEIEFELNGIAPTNDLEYKLIKIWSSVLNISHLGITDDYFGLGGDSIKAIKLIYEINEQLGCTLELADLYNFKTIKSIGGLLIKNQHKEVKLYLNAEEEIRQFQKVYKDNNDFHSQYQEVFPMSGIEKGMIFYTMLKGENESSFDNILYHEQNFYNIPYANFDINTFYKALELMTDKHDTLRKVYDLDNFAHIILKKIEPEIEYLDLTSYSHVEQEQIWQEKINSGRLRASGKSGELLWWMTFLKISDDFHYLLFDMHHSVFDGWSLHSFLTELNNIYLKLLEDIDFVPERLECTYENHILGEIVDSNQILSLDYWQNELDGYNRFPFFKISQEHRFITKYFPMDPKLKIDLKLLATKLDTTIKDLCFSAFAFTMSMLAHIDDFVVGYSTNNRPLTKDGEKILGCFINQIPFRVNIPSEGSWSDFIQTMGKKNKKLKSHERMPFYKILESITEEPSEEWVNPVFDLAFNYIDFWVIGDLISPANVSQENPGFWHDGNDVNQNTLFDFHVKTTMDTFTVVMEYSTTILDEGMIYKIFKYFESTLNQFVNHSEDRLSKDIILSDVERDELLHVYNDTAVAYPLDRTVIDLFEDQVEKAPDNVAVSYLSSELSY